MDNASTIELKFVRTNFFTRWPCTFCGGETEKVAILCEGEGLRACEQCLEAGQGRLDERLQETADACEVHAKALRGLIGRVKIPTYEAWRTVEDADHGEDREAAQAQLTEEEAESSAAWEAAQERRHALAEKVGAAIASGFAAGFDMPVGETVSVHISVFSGADCDQTLFLTCEGAGRSSLPLRRKMTTTLRSEEGSPL
jgi:hypothetical protein